MKTSQRITLEHFLFFLAFLMALLIRFLNLGVQPLTDLEAKWALQASEIARGSKPFLGAHPAYLLMTAMNFFVFGTSNFMARFWPALVGAGMTLAPAAFQKQLGRKTAILLAFGLALDPGLLAVSRMAGSQMMAVGFMVFCLAAWQNGSYKWAGLLGGLALLCGPSAWFGVMGLTLTWLIMRFTGFRNQEASSLEVEEKGDELLLNPERKNPPLKTFMTWAAATLLLAGTSLLLVPNGLSAWAGSIAEFLAGWGSPGRLPLWLFPLTVLVYGLLALIFGVIKLVRGVITRNGIVIKLGVLTGVFFLLALLYPAHQTADLIWMLVPLWSLAAMEISRYLDFAQMKITSLVMATLTSLVFWVFVWLNLAGISASFNNPDIISSRLLLLLGAIFIMILSLFLASAVMDEKIVVRGTILGIVIAMMMYMISAGFNASGHRLPFSFELWQPAPQFAQGDLLKETVNDLSVWRRGQTKSISITTLADLNSPSLLWLLRDWQVDLVDAIPLDASPELVILPQGLEIKIASSYRGQDFVLRKSPVWEGLSAAGWLRWVAFRELPEQTDVIVLWARNDLFLDGRVDLETTTP